MMGARAGGKRTVTLSQQTHKDRFIGVFALHRYFYWADRMRVHFDGRLAARLKESAPPKVDEDIELTMYMLIWYALTYTVVEGWQELKLSDPEVDRLLRSSNVHLLKRCRNGVLHYSSNYWDQRFLDLISSPDSASWIRELRKALSDYFLRWYAARKGDQAKPL
jgi:hypothetical protein